MPTDKCLNVLMTDITTLELEERSSLINFAIPLASAIATCLLRVP